MRPQNSPHAGDAKPNRLIQEKSPYLLQHAYNPVDWYAWGDEAFEAARRQNKPIFLSIGYSTCHWCHVMERESFERPEVAREMNEAFVSIKVDREERPDIDNVYMRVCQMVTGSGGWPLTIVMTPDKKPFFAGTYIPPGDRFGRAGMLTLIPRIREAWTDRRDDVERSAEEIVEALEQASSASTPGALTAATLDAAYEELSARFDARFGGFGMAPKFPTPHNLLFLLRYAKRTGDARGLNMVERTLTAMRQGGIYDHVGFGFHRYSTDAEWLVPHFEKMLYDQALLALAYTEAFQVTNRQDYASAAREILAYTSRALTDAEGGFYSAEDADSEGVEGKFYLWTEAELREVLDHDDAEFVIRVFNVHRDGNFSDPMGGEGGENILYISKSPAELALELGVMAPELTRRWGAIREKLFAVREARGHPHRDDKVLADWNGLMVAAYAKAARALREPSLAEPARRAADFVLSRMRAQDGGLLHRWRDGEAAVAGHLDDYAFMILGLTELYETTFDPGLLRTALELNEHALKEFWDDERGGFFFTAANREQVLVRSKEIYDGAVPSGNSVQMLNLLRLAHLTGQTELAEEADHLGRAFAASIAHSPAAYTFWMVALDFALGPTSETVIAGDPHAEDTRAMLDALAGTFFPRAVTLLVPNDGRAEDLARIAGFTRSMKSAGGPALAYVCRDFHCNLPTKDPEQMLRLLTAL